MGLQILYTLLLLSSAKNPSKDEFHAEDHPPPFFKSDLVTLDSLNFFPLLQPLWSPQNASSDLKNRVHIKWPNKECNGKNFSGMKLLREKLAQTEEKFNKWRVFLSLHQTCY